MPAELPKKDITKEIIQLLKGMPYSQACLELDIAKGRLEQLSIVTVS